MRKEEGLEDAETEGEGRAARPSRRGGASCCWVGGGGGGGDGSISTEGCGRFLPREVGETGEAGFSMIGAGT